MTTVTFTTRMAPGDSLELLKAAPESLSDTALIHWGSTFIGLLGKGRSGRYYIWMKRSDRLHTFETRAQVATWARCAISAKVA